MRVRVLLLIWALNVARVDAFDGGEHKRTSDAALQAAVAMVRPSVSKQMDGAVTALQKATPGFGDVTVAVDWYQSPEHLLNAKDFARAAGGRNFIMKGLAKHNNADHFQAAALKAWCRYHVGAISAASHDPAQALLREAVALHYLQDYFAAGHLVTPREGMHDAVAGHLHDAFNRNGVTFTITEDEHVTRALKELRTGDWITAEDESAFHTAFAEKPKFHGDSSIEKKNAPAQKTFVAVVSALSVAEVLAASSGEGKQPKLQTCFATRTVTIGEKGKKTFTGPDGGIRLSHAESIDRVVACNVDDSPWLGRYNAIDDPALTKDFYDLFGITLRGEAAVSKTSKDVRINTDLMFFIFADDPAGSLYNTSTKKPYNPSKWAALTMGAVGLSRSRGDGYNAWAFLYDFYQATPLRSVAWGFRFAPRRYTYQHTHHWKWDFGVKGTVGLDVININLAIERGRHFDTAGRFRPTYFAVVGVETSTPGSWVRKALGR